MKNKKRVIAERKYNTHLVEHEEASTPLPTRRKPVWTRVLLVHTARRAGEDEAAAKLTLHMLTVATPLLHHLPQLLLNLFFSIPIIIIHTGSIILINYIFVEYKVPRIQSYDTHAKIKLTTHSTA